MIASKHIFGGGPYSVAGSPSLRVVGQKRWPVSEIEIGRAAGGVRDRQGRWRPTWVEPFMPRSITAPYHPSGNSACYMIQTAHLMGCDPILLLGFTLDSGSGYFFGLDNPVTRKRSLYDSDRALAWLRWYESRYPGRAKLWPGWSGPIYDVLQVLDEAEAQALSGSRPRDQREANGLDGQEVERLRPDREDQPVHADEEQSLRDW